MFGLELTAQLVGQVEQGVAVEVDLTGLPRPVVEPSRPKWE